MSDGFKDLGKKNDNNRIANYSYILSGVFSMINLLIISKLINYIIDKKI